MHKIAITLLGLTVLSGPAWSQANLRPDPHPRVPPQPGQSLPLEDALFLKEAAWPARSGRAGAARGRESAGRCASLACPRIAETHGRLAGDLKRLTDGRTLPPADQLQPKRTDDLGAAGAVSNPENAARA